MPRLRVRHAYLKIENAVVDVLAGQTYHLLGWQNYFFGASCGFLGLPNALFNRTVQLRLSHTFESDAVNIDIAAAAFRPAQRDSALPEAGGGFASPSITGRGSPPRAAAERGLCRPPRRFGSGALVQSGSVCAACPPRPSRSLGWAVAANSLIPIIPVKDNTDRGNALTVTGEFVTGTGDADQYSGMTAGATMPNAYQFPPDTPVMAGGMAAPPDWPACNRWSVSPTRLTSTRDWWRSIRTAGFTPSTGRPSSSASSTTCPRLGASSSAANYSQANSNNIASLFHPGSTRQPWVNSLAVFHSSRYFDGNIFFDVTPAVRVGAVVSTGRRRSWQTAPTPTTIVSRRPFSTSSSP